MNHFHVAAGILQDSAAAILITERLLRWAFRRAVGVPWRQDRYDKETAGSTACDRELAEELGIAVTALQAFMALHHEYPDRTVDLEFFLVTEWQGNRAGLEGQGRFAGLRRASWISRGIAAG